MALPNKLKRIPKLHLISLIVLFITLLVLISIWTGRLYSTHLYKELSLSLPKISDKNKGSQKNINWQSDKVVSGDSISNLFSRNGLNASDAHFIGKASSRESRLIKPGQRFRWHTNQKGEVEALHIEISATKTHIFNRQEDGSFSYKLQEKDTDSRPRYATATIENSLFLDGGQAGIPQQVLIELAGIFGWDIDFAQDLRKGDKFSLIYEETFLDGKHIGNGDILVARFINKGRSYTALRYKSPNGKVSYYNEKGLSMRKAFLRNPIDFARISSRFNLRRRHPVLNKIRAHKGTDYAAAIGTPIKSTGDGKVIFHGWKGGYGKTVVIQHGSRYQTLYAHLSQYNRKATRGRYVKQGQIIGYVGTTGLSTGPHLHYEFRVDGVHRDSLKVKLPTASPIPKKHRETFLKAANQKVNWLESYQKRFWQ